MKIGFIGLGAMGRFMAANLLADGHDMSVHDLSERSARSLIEQGARWASSPAEVAYAADVLFTCLPGPAEVEGVALGEGGLLGAMRSGSVWFDLTTNAPAVVQRLNRSFGAANVHMLDAPISGGPAGAEARSLASWVGGDRAIFDRYEWLLRTVAGEPLYMGPSGSGCLTKLVHNCASFSVQNAVAEAFTLGVKAGLDPLTLFEALRNGTTGRSRTFDRISEQLLPGIYDPPAFALDLAHKDMSIALSLARSCGFPMPIAETTLQDMGEAMRRGWSQHDARIALSLHQERAGVSVRVSPDEIKQRMNDSNFDKIGRGESETRKQGPGPAADG